MHLLQLMTPWAIVCDGWCLEPQNLKPRDTPIQFAERVRDIIFVREGLKKVIWDGFLKYSRPRPNHRERKAQTGSHGRSSSAQKLRLANAGDFSGGEESSDHNVNKNKKTETRLVETF